MSSRREASQAQWLLRLVLIFGTAAPGLFIKAAWAQLQFGQIQGKITNKDTGQPFPGVTIVVNGPALQGDQTEISDSNGRYLITQLPSGDNYVVRYYFNDVVVERPGVHVAQNTTLSINLAMPTHKGASDKIVVHERAPNVDTANANTGVEVNQELLQNTAVRGRTYESVMSLAPGSADVAPRRVTGGDVGVSFSGSTGNENSLLIDGLNTTDLNTGVLATQLHQYFIQEVNVITGGYQAEYGRATGGVVSVITKSGSNEFHGGIFGSWAPFQATPNTVARLGEALASRSRQLSQYDYGFELGGPIVKDRIWFYVGFAPTTTVNRTERIVRTQLLDSCDQMTKTCTAQRDPNYQAPPWLASPALSAGLDTLALATNEISSTNVDETTRLYNWIAKLQFNINPDHNITLGYIGSPQFSDFYDNLNSLGLRNSLSAIHDTLSQQIHDGTVHYIGKLFDRKLQIDVLYGYHYQGSNEIPYNANQQSIRYRASADNPFSLADFENVPGCAYQTVGAAKFNPCPITDYTYGGLGLYTPTRVLQRHALQASGTLYVSLLGNHAFKLGFDFEDNLNDGTRKFTGTPFSPNDPFSGNLMYQTDATGTQLRINRGYGLPVPMDPYGQIGTPCGNQFYSGGMPDRWCYDHFRATTETRNYATYLRDSWNVSFLPGLVVNAGLRWEVQEVYGSNGQKQITLWDNLAPRVGLAYDPTHKGRAKVYANYGRFYESIPMDINDRSFSGEGYLVGTAKSQATDCPKVPLQPNGMPVVYPQNGGPGAPCSLGDPIVSGGGVYAPVMPGLKGQYLDEVVVGGQYDVGMDIVVGAYYTYRHLGNIIEDLSVDGGNTYFIANPGSQPDPTTTASLQADLARAQQVAAASPGDAGLASLVSDAQKRLDVYKAVALFPKATREYHAATLTVNKRLSNRFSILANYTYSRLFGNYPGPFSPWNNQLDPNISTQFDLINLTVNRTGPLVNDRPHNFKITGFYAQPLMGGKATLVGSLTFTALSGRPIMVLGADAQYGPRESFILPAGSGGRTPTITQLDAHIGYDQQLGEKVKLSVFLDIINLLDEREVINVDDEYTFSSVNPIQYGTPDDLKKLRAVDGSKLVLNSNYGQPTAYQAPLTLRFGGRLSF